MEAVVFEGIRTRSYKTFPIPGIGPNDVLVRVEAVAFAGRTCKSMKAYIQRNFR